MRLYAALIVLSLFTVPTAHAADDENSRITLRGLKGVQIIVNLSRDIEQNGGLTAKAIRTDVELKLRQAAIPVLATADPYLYVAVGIVPASDRVIWPYVIAIELRQPVVLTRDSSTLAPDAARSDIATGA
jgi:hypothetical protein